MSSVCEPVTVVVTRRVLPGREADYEHWITGITKVALTFPGHLGMNVFRPQRIGDPYILVYKFDSGEHLDAWVQSEERARWIAEAMTMTSESGVEEASGLETWFTLPGQNAMVPPPKWKMAIVTTVAVFVLANLIGPAVRHLTPTWPSLVSSLVSTVVVVVLLSWVVMPRITRLLARWLYVDTVTPRVP